MHLFNLYLNYVQNINNVQLFLVLAVSVSYNFITSLRNANKCFPFNSFHWTENFNGTLCAVSVWGKIKWKWKRKVLRLAFNRLYNKQLNSCTSTYRVWVYFMCFFFSPFFFRICCTILLNPFDTIRFDWWVCFYSSP